VAVEEGYELIKMDIGAFAQSVHDYSHPPPEMSIQVQN
jgi:hypothetical protein